MKETWPMYDLHAFTTVDQKRHALQRAARENLEAYLLDEHYNEWLSNASSWPPNTMGTHGGGTGKRLPYIGWFWRRILVSAGHVAIGDCRGMQQTPLERGPGFIGVMQNNKWGYPERAMTKEEFTEFMALVDAAMHDNAGASTLNAHCKKIWDWFQTLKI